MFAATLTSAAVLLAGPVLATPAFSEKTKLDCNACHTRGYPLTPLGDKFKANNYKLPAAKRPCKKVTIKLFDAQGVFQRRYSGCFPTDGAKITIGQ